MSDELVRLRFKAAPTHGAWQAADVQRLRRAAAAHGFHITANDASLAWEWYSEGRAASWLGMDAYDDNQLWAAVEDYFEEETDA